MKISRIAKTTALVSAILVLILLGTLTILTINNDQTYYGDLSDALEDPGGVEILVMRNRKLKVIPGEIARLRHLKILNLGNNELTSLPPEIFELTELEELDVTNNALTEIPDGIVKLVHLKKLNISHNKLRRFPTVAPDAIEEMYLSDNEIMIIPSFIRDMKRLRVLDLGDNKVERISPDIVFPDSIRRIDLFNNSLKSAPVRIFLLPALHELILEGNPLNETTLDLYNKFRHQP